MVHISAVAVRQPNHGVTLYCLNRTAVNRLLQHPVQCEGVQTLAVHCHTDVCTAALNFEGILHGVERPRLSAASCHVVTSHGVTVCDSKFPPTVSKHCQHQHSATHKTVQQYETPTTPAVVISKVQLPQSNIMAAFVHSCSSLVSDVSPGLPTYNNHNVTQFTVQSVWPLAVNCSVPVLIHKKMFLAKITTRKKTWSYIHLVSVLICP